MKHSLPLIGWREYVCLPQLGIEKIKAKIDTGARTSALHAYHIHTYQEGEQQMVEFKVHPLQRQTHVTISCTAPLLGYRKVTNSGGHATIRPVILTSIRLGEYQWQIELTLTNRDVMGFRMLLGREAIRRKFLVDAGHSFIYGRHP
ncbi:MAG: RimK/LysX family protein [Geminocystis sp.]|nr:RimK/LysX family protein [Geminocystis sp.]HIK36466.1 ATP-dependent zinc protease [Geminocystis sp. M7585_C2015_104]MCS7147596.1 RimK/LysX family protein [Geminocystis sp.]MCX8077999.1 RimK/LysX family protein [Geminocystis sp.]MDW8115289.1 RimK/LysX family protein [Geminocystis sp.]